MYLYSVIALYALYRGIMAVKDVSNIAHLLRVRADQEQEDPKQTLYFAHFYFADHVFSTSWTIYFAVVWWLRTPHNGERPEYSPAQQQIIDGAVLSSDPLPDDQRAEAAMLIWNHEKGFALTVIILSWLSKVRCSTLTSPHVLIATFRFTLFFSFTRMLCISARARTASSRGQDTRLPPPSLPAPTNRPWHTAKMTTETLRTSIALLPALQTPAILSLVLQILSTRLRVGLDVRSLRRLVEMGWGSRTMPRMKYSSMMTS